MANRFRDSFFQNKQNQQQNSDAPFSNPQETANQFNQFRNNPIEFLNSRGYQVPKEYANNPEAMARYMLKNMPGFQQNKIFQLATMLGQMFGFRS